MPDFDKQIIAIIGFISKTMCCVYLFCSFESYFSDTQVLKSSECYERHLIVTIGAKSTVIFTNI